MDQNQTKNKSMVTILVIILIVVIGALYIFASKSDESSIPSDGSNTEIQTVTKKSDDISSIEADINMSVEGLDQQTF